MSEKADIIGQFVMQNLRDVALDLCDGLCEERFSSPGHKELQIELRQLTEVQKKLVRKCVAYCVDGALNDFIYRLEDVKSTTPISLTVVSREGISTDRLHRKLHGRDGWKERFSKFDCEGKRSSK